MGEHFCREQVGTLDLAIFFSFVRSIEGMKNERGGDDEWATCCRTGCDTAGREGDRDSAVTVSGRSTVRANVL